MYSIIFKMLRKNFRNGRMCMMRSERTGFMRCYIRSERGRSNVKI